MFNVFVANGNQELPDDDIFYVVAGNGIFIRKKLGILDALVPASSIPHLDYVAPYATLDIPKIPRNDFAQIVSFFREVYDEHRSEAVSLLHFNEKKQDYKIQIPFQEVSGGSVDYEKTLPWQEQGYILMCTIHSHAGFGAFHSGTDNEDEKHFDGLHITVGDLSKDLHTISTSIVVNGKRFIVETEEYVEGTERVEYSNYFGQHMFRPTFKIVNGVKIYDKDIKKQVGFYVDNVPFDRAWMDFVEKKTPLPLLNRRIKLYLFSNSVHIFIVFISVSLIDSILTFITCSFSIAHMNRFDVNRKNNNIHITANITIIFCMLSSCFFLDSL